MSESLLVIFQAESGAIELKGDFSNETVWATQQQIAGIFELDQSVVSRHISHVFKSGEVDKKSNMQKMHIAKSDKPVGFYSLDIILAVGYRANSQMAIRFRKWATQTLKKHITEGFTINPSCVKQNRVAFLSAVEDLRVLAGNSEHMQIDNVLSLVKSFAKTWFSLESYDEDKLPNEGERYQDTQLNADELYQAISVLKKNLMEKNQATLLFAQEKDSKSLEGILGSIYQSAFGESAYPTLEDKAAHLLYFIVKNHPFNDGNKRTGAFSFIWFLQKTDLSLSRKITPEALTALTILVAESKPENKGRMIGMIILLLTGTLRDE